jgi:hypothetical protein
MVIGVLLDQSHSEWMDMERDYCILYRGPDGKPLCDSIVAECWIHPCDGWIDPKDKEELQALIRQIVQEKFPEVELLNEE